ncbi:NAD(P)-binding protein [Trametopsis cervina]|nr:NAD(P)-binding protein [Trametopsis cervina]
MGGLFSSSFDPSKDLLDLHGKVAIVTGGNAGMGFWIVHHLRRHGAKVYLAARNEARATDALRRLDALGRENNDGAVEWLPLDLDDPRGVRRAVDAFTEKETRLDILVNNAGMMAAPYEKTDDGVVRSMVVNHISPFVFVDALSELLEKTATERDSDVRVVNVASLIHSMASSKFDSLDAFNKFYGTGYIAETRQYAQTKLANILWTNKLQERFDDRGANVTCISLNPGGVHTDTAVDKLRTLPLGGLLVRLTGLISYLPEQGAYTALFAAASPAARAYRGLYLVPFGKPATPSSAARDPLLADTLWKTTVQILGDVYGLRTRL